MQPRVTLGLTLNIFRFYLGTSVTVLNQVFTRVIRQSGRTDDALGPSQPAWVVPRAVVVGSRLLSLSDYKEGLSANVSSMTVRKDIQGKSP